MKSTKQFCRSRLPAGTRPGVPGALRSRLRGAGPIRSRVAAARRPGLAARVCPYLLLIPLIVLPAAGGCQRAAERPDVVLVTIDTLRSDHCSAYGYPIPTTPNLDAVAAGGVLYRRTYAETSTTAPSHAVLMTGRHFRTFGVTKNGATLSPDSVTLAEAMRDAGYATAAFVSSFPLMSRFGFSQGFEVYDDDFTPEEASLGRRAPGEAAHDRIAGATLAHLEKWLGQRHDGRPLFLWMHFVDPHAPYRAPERLDAKWPAGVRSAIPRYDAEVHYADEQLGRVLELVARYTPAHEDFIVVTSDHGEGLGDHGWMSHGINLHEEAVRVPLVARWPGHLPEGKVSDDLVGLVDVAPGILSMLGIEAKTFTHGRKLFGPPDPARSIFMQRRDYKSARENGQMVAGEMTAVVEGSSKLIVAPEEQRREFYDLAADPQELHDLLAAAGQQQSGSAAGAPDAEAEREAAARRLETVLADWRTAFPAVKSNASLDKETLKALRSLGYVD